MNPALVSPGTFRPFVKADWDCYSGVESKEPLIADLHDGYTAVILDGSRLSFVTCNDEGGQREWMHEYEQPATAEAVANAAIKELMDMPPANRLNNLDRIAYKFGLECIVP